MNIVKKIISLMVTCSLFSSLTIAALDYSGLGSLYFKTIDNIAPGLTYNELYANDAKRGNQKAFVFEYIPGLGTLPTMRFGASVYGKDTLDSLINQATENGDDIVGAINSDFFSLKTGIPMSVLIENGKLISSCDNRSAIGFKSDNTVIIGKPNITINGKIGERKFKINHINKYPSPYGIYLLTNDFSNTTQSTEPSTEIILEITNSTFYPDGIVDGIITDIKKDSFNTPIPPNSFVISVHNKATNFSDFSDFAIGQTLSISTYSDPLWSDVIYAVGGGDQILINSVMPDGIVDEPHESQVHPRSAVGITPEGKAIFFAIDGRQKNYSMGITIAELSNVMKELGCVSALNLDGGGSTTVAVKTSDNTIAQIVNKPSDGFQRPLSNAVLFVNSLKETNIPSHLVLNPISPCVLKSGGIVDISALLRDTAYKFMNVNVASENLAFELSSPMGIFTGNKFMAGDKNGDVLVTAKTDIDGITVKGSTKLTIVNSLSDFNVYPLNIQIPTDSSYKIDINGYLNGIYTYVSPSQFTWSFKENNIQHDDPKVLALSDVGYIDTDGIFYAFKDSLNKTATLNVTYGYKTQSININIGMQPEIINDFETDTVLSEIFNIDDIMAINYIDFGKNSDRAISLNGNEIVYKTPKVLNKSAKAIDIWVHGDSQGSVYTGVVDSKNNKYDLLFETVIDHSSQTGWKLLRATIPSNIVQNSPITIISPFKMLEKQELIIDNISVYYGDDEIIFEDIESHWGKNEINNAYYMEITNGEIHENKRYYYPDRNLTRAEFAKMLVSFKGLNLSDYMDTTIDLADLADIPEWALPYIKAVIGSGLMKGKTNNEGKLCFFPKENINRVEVMYVFGSMLGDEYLDGNFEFTDSNKIAEWAFNNVKKTVLANIITGYTDNTIKPLNNITRSEIATIFSRMGKTFTT